MVCLHPSTKDAEYKTRLESGIKKAKPRRMYGLFFAYQANFLRGLSTDRIQVVFVNMDIFAFQTLTALEADIKKALVALAFVGAWLLLHTFSPFLAVMGALPLVNDVSLVEPKLFVLWRRTSQVRFSGIFFLS